MTSTSLESPITLKADLHGHSIHSDGKNTPGEIVRAAVKNGVNVLGISDHHSVAGWPEFLAEIKTVNAHSPVLVGIPGIEITSQQGDVLVALPNLELVDKFQAEYQPDKFKPHLIDVLKKYITEYQALCILLHPEYEYIRGVTGVNITKTLNELQPILRQNVGIEIFNWMAHVSPNRSKTEAKLLELNDRHWHLTTLGNTDYHRAQDVGNGFSSAELPELSTNAFVTAFQQHQLTPQTKKSSLFDFNQRVFASLEAYRNGKIRDIVMPEDQPGNV